MPNLQQSTLIEFVKPQTLKPHPLNTAIYGEDGYQDLVESIRNLGVLQALYVTSSNVILSGHRRWRAAITAECSRVPIIRMNYTNELDEHRAIIEHNRYRIKNGQQLYNEGKELEGIEAETARQRQLLTLKQGAELPDVDKCPQREQQGKTRDAVAKAIGLGSGRQWDRLKDVAENAPELLAEIKPHGLSISGACAKVKKEQRKAKIEVQREAINKLTPPTERIWDVIVLDPPWPIAGEYDSQGRRAANPYPTMAIKDIENISLPATENCVLWLWVTNLNMHDGLHLLAHWGFEFRNILTWAKDKFGIGVWLRGQTEHCLLATMGKPIFTGESTSTLLNAPRIEHSAKPDAFYQLVERTCCGRKLDYFGRKPREGWDVYGDEV